MVKHRIVTGIGIALAIVVVGVAIWQMQEKEAPPGLLMAGGRIEGRITTMTPKVAGRVAEIAVDEGETINVGALLTMLEDEALRERVRAAEENVDALSHQLRGSETRIEVLRSQVPLQISQAESAISEASARVGRSRAQYQQALRDAERYEELVKENLVSPQTTDSARLKVIMERNSVLEAEAALARAEKQLALSRLGEQLIQMRAAERDALRCQSVQAQAALAEQESYMAELAIRSPLDGTVLTRNIEMGERVNPGTPLFTLVDLDRLYLKVYVPEPDVGKLALGQEARVYIDAYQERLFPAKVTKVSQQAEFTPKMVETREERVKLVFAVELSFEENPGGVLKPGMPADAVIRWQEDAPWATP